MNAPTRPVLRWHGGKWRLAPWIIQHLPPHRVYVEPFGGAASVLLRKPRSYAEIYNDMDEMVVSLFRVLREQAQARRLIDLLRLTPFARAEFEVADRICSEPLEMARRLIVRSFMGFGSNAHGSPPLSRVGFRGITRGVNRAFRSTGFRANSGRSGTTPAHDWHNYPDALVAIVERLQGVIIERRDASMVMAQHDSAESVHYVDPPYLPELRSPANKLDQKHRMYRHEMTANDHKRLLDFLNGLKGGVIVSGYPSPLYDTVLKGWLRVEKQALADGARSRTEVLWINRRASDALDARLPLGGAA